jgi:branched-chain amino acid transport system permease protein
MGLIFSFVLLGLEASALAAGLALGLVITFRSSGVVNFAAGATAMFSSYMFYGLHTNGKLFGVGMPGGALSTVPAFVGAVLIAALLGYLQYVIVYRKLREAGAIAKMVASAGVMLILIAVIVLAFGSDPYSNAPLLPSGAVTVLGSTVPGDRLWLTGIVVAIATVLWGTFRYTRFGIATRAAEDSRKGALLLGFRADRNEGLNWVIATTLIAVVGILGSSVEGLAPTGFTDVLIPALAAALLGGLSSVSRVTLGAFFIGAIQALLGYAQTKSWYPQSGGQPLPGVPDGVPFVIIAVILFRSGRGLSDRLTGPAPRLPEAFRPTHLRARFGISTATVIVLLAVLSYGWRQSLINTMIGALLCLSFVVLTGYTGQISFAQMTLAGVSGFMLARLSVHWGIPFPLAPLLAVITAVAVSAIVAIPALRLRGLQLAVLTLAGAVAVESVWFNNPDWGGGSVPANVTEPSLFGIGLGPLHSFWNGDGAAPSPGFGLFVLAVLVFGAWLVVNLRRSPSGSRLLAVRSDESAAAAAGVNVAKTKLHAFLVAGFLAGAAGVLYAYNLQAVTSDEFDAITAVSIFAGAYLGGITTVTGAVLAGTLVSQGLGIHVLNALIGVPNTYQPLLAGVGVLGTVLGNPDGIAGFMHRKWDSFDGWRGGRLPFGLKGPDQRDPVQAAPRPERIT